jgi:hypothetical protein
MLKGGVLQVSYYRSLRLIAIKAPDADDVALLLRTRQMGDVLNELATNGEEGARAKARLWTWHFATDHGRAYMRSGRRCSGMTQLASLIAVDPQVTRHTTTLLCYLPRHATRWADL